MQGRSRSARRAKGFLHAPSLAISPFVRRCSFAQSLSNHIVSIPAPARNLTGGPRVVVVIQGLLICIAGAVGFASQFPVWARAFHSAPSRSSYPVTGDFLRQPASKLLPWRSSWLYTWGGQPGISQM
jgi:hypothetical protein